MPACVHEGTLMFDLPALLPDAVCFRLEEARDALRNGSKAQAARLVRGSPGLGFRV